MDPKRKKIYLIALGVCVLVLVGVLFWSKSSTPSTPAITTAPSPIATSPTTSRQPVSEVEINTTGVYPAPMVFPQSRSFDSTALDDLKAMKSFSAIKLGEGELGRTNPLADY
jgi:hypothetical protein